MGLLRSDDEALAVVLFSLLKDVGSLVDGFSLFDFWFLGGVNHLEDSLRVFYRHFIYSFILNCYSNMKASS